MVKCKETLKLHQLPKDTFGMLKRKWNKSTQQIKDEIRAELYSE